MASAAAQGQGQGQKPGQGQGEQPGQGQSVKKGGAAKNGQKSDNQAQAKGELETAETANADSRGEKGGQDAAGGGLQFEREPWFAKLPPSLKAAIQTKTHGKAPRGYEERLRRYFESVD